MTPYLQTEITCYREFLKLAKFFIQLSYALTMIDSKDLKNSYTLTPYPPSPYSDSDIA